MDNQNEEIKEQSGVQEQLTAEPEITKRKKITINKRTVILAVIIVVVAALVGLGWRYKGLLIAATVNGSPISRLAVISELEKSSGKGALDSMINQKLIDDEASKKGITVTSDEVSTQIKTIEDQLKAQGQTLDQALSAQGMTQADLEKQVLTQKKLEKLLADKIAVTDAEVAQYIKDNKVTVPAGQEATYNTQIKNQIEQQKFSDAATALVGTLRSQAKINYYVNY